MSSAIKKFFEKLRTGNATSDKYRELTLQPNLINGLEVLSNNNNSLALLKQFFSTAQFQVIDEEIFINDTPVKKIESLLRAGKLKELFNLLHISSEVTTRDEYNFQSLLQPEIPEVNILKFAERYKQAQLQHPDLDFIVTSSADIQRKLTTLAKDKLKIFLNRLQSMASKTQVVDGLFAKVKVDKDVVDNIAVAAKSREGCYLVKTDKSKTKSFKLINRSCSQTSDLTQDTSSEFEPIADSLPYNLQIYLQVLLNEKFLTTKKTERENLINELGLTAAEVIEENIPYLVMKYESKLSKYFSKNNYGNTLFNQLPNEDKKFLHEDLCKLNHGNPCVSCSPLAPRNSIDYVDISKLPVNMTVMYVKKATLLELLVDFDVNLCICACRVL
uniref:Putative envelope protein ODV-E56-2 protein n=1 Tax=Cotesia congregata TaxID=51543 RepID=B9W490_COTCN|nr:putative envelope protein ODV-E56-2 protein [Cotesia congregata]